MGKSRSRAAKAADVFRIARSAAAAKARGKGKGKGKGRARPVTSGLKQINIKNAEKVNTINKAFAEVRKEIQQISKGTAAEPEKSHELTPAPAPCFETYFATRLDTESFHKCGRGASKCGCCHKPIISVVMHNGQ